MTPLRLATRGSELALIQAHWVAEAITRAAPGERVTVVEISTTGDRDRTTEVTELTELGAFVRGVQTAVLDGDADLAVHSCKDLPTAGPPGLHQWYPGRVTPWDTLCRSTLDGLPERAVVGTGSPRRAAQLMEIRRDLEIVPIRGNVPTRLDMVTAGDLDAVVLAAAALERLGRNDDIGQTFSIEEMVPAPGQGALCVEARPGTRAAEVLDAIDAPGVRHAVEAERTLLSLTGAGCRAALGAFATVGERGVQMDGFVADERGPRRAIVAGSDGHEAALRMRQELGL